MAGQSFISEASSVVAKDKKSKTAIYHPPKPGMPFLVVTVSPEGVTATAVASKHEARVLASKKTMSVQFQDETPETAAGTGGAG
jgi:hypothetical protein